MKALQQAPKPFLAITMGDPCGVGPEVIVKALGSRDPSRVCSPLVIGSSLALRRAASLLGDGVRIREIDSLASFRHDSQGEIQVISPIELTPDDIQYGHPTEATARAVIEYVTTAVQLAMSRAVQGICTCPIHKAVLHEHGFRFPGHTEFLRSLTGADNAIMMLAGPRLRVSLATVHTAIANVPGFLTIDRIVDTIRITGEALLHDFGISPVRLAVAGLNPHAGENGSFGTEEIDFIDPAVKYFRDAPFLVMGPFPPDTVFHRAYEGEFDAVVAMYHDQGLIPLKLVHFYSAVNITLGLPIVRTSVDHGTGYDIAGTGKAHPGSLTAAIELASLVASNRMMRDKSFPYRVS